MSGPGPIPPGRVPTLTEVVGWPPLAPSQPGALAPPGHAVSLLDAAGAGGEAAPARAPSTSGSPPGDEQIVQRVLVDLQRQVDLMLEYRLREVLTPLLARAADSVVRDARAELASTLRDLVSRAVAQELARHRPR